MTSRPDEISSQSQDISAPASPVVAAALLKEPLFDEFEDAWQAGKCPCIETFLIRVPKADRSTVLQELLGIELELRLRCGDVPLLTEYRQRFPDDTAVVEYAYRTALKQPNVARFQPIDRLGVGAQGEVWLMLDPQMDRRVALKIVQPSLQGTEPTLSHFRREAEVSGKLEHPNIVPVYDLTAELDETGQDNPDSPCYVMRVFGDPRLHVAIAAFHERPRSIEDQELLQALRAFDKERSSEHRTVLEARLEAFSFDCQQPCDQALKSAVESILKKHSEAGTLTKAITRLHSGDWSETALRRLLNRFQRVCEGVAYAHNRGVIHRDLKPDNIMLGEYGETLVADWGLAKVVDRDDAHQSTEEALLVSSDEEDPTRTMQGAVKGTPAYMSPEQALGHIDELGPATDIYSLGAILHCLLTGQHPFNGKNVTEVSSLVQDGKFPLPTEIQPRVPKALEAIVLKAMSLKPRDRYVRALDLAADVERWLNDEPVKAWPEPFTIRAKRWGRKHETAVTAVAVIFLMTIIALSVMVAVESGHRSELATLLERERNATALAKKNEQIAVENEKRAAANEQRAIKGEEQAKQNQMLAEKNAAAAAVQSRLALSTIQSVIFDVQTSLENLPGGAEVRQKLLKNVLPQLEKVSTEYASKSTVDRNMLAALMALADTILQLGEIGQNAKIPSDDSVVIAVERISRQAHMIAEQLASAKPDDLEAQRDLSVSHNERGDVLLRLGRTREVLEHFEFSLMIRQKLADAFPDDAEKQRDLATSFMRLGDVFLMLGRIDDALEQFEARHRISTALVAADPRNTQKQRDLSYSLERLGDVFLKLGRTDDAMERFQAKHKISLELVESEPHDARNQRDLSISFERLGGVFLTLGRTDYALEQFESALKISHMLADVDPRDIQKQRDVAASTNRLGDVFLNLGRTDDALKQFEAGLKLNRTVAENDPRDVQKQHALSASLNRLGDVFLTLGRTNDALKQFEDAQKIIRAVAEADPRDVQKQNALSVSYDKLGGVFRTLGRTRDAYEQFLAGLSIRRALVDTAPSDTQMKRNLSVSFEKLGDVMLTLGRTDDAIKQFESALSVRRELADADSRNGQLKRDLSVSTEKLGDVLIILGSTNDALKQFEAALITRSELAKADPLNTQKQRDLWVSHNKVGEGFLKLRRSGEALEQFEAGFKIINTLVEADHNDSQKRRDLSISYNKLGDVFVVLGRINEALEKFEAGFAIRRKLADADPHDMQKQADLSISFERLGDMFLKLGHVDKALEKYTAKQQIDLALVKGDSGNADKLGNLSISYGKRGTVLLKLGSTSDAVEQFQEGLRIRQQLAEADPRNGQKQHNLVSDLYTLGEAQIQNGKFESAIQCFQQGIAVLDDMIAKKLLVELAGKQQIVLKQRIKFCHKAHLATGDWETLLKVDLQELSNLLSLRATGLAKRGQLQEVAQTGDKLRELAATAENGAASEQKGGLLYKAACAYSLCAMLAVKEITQPTEVEQTERKKYLDLSLSCLKEAVTGGYNNFDHMRKDDDLKPLRSLPEFEMLLQSQKKQ